jgi:hypothetical protein
MKRKIFCVLLIVLILFLFSSTIATSNLNNLSDESWKIRGIITEIELSGTTDYIGFNFFFTLEGDQCFAQGAKISYSNGNITNLITGDNYQGKFAVNMFLFKGSFNFGESSNQNEFNFKGTVLFFQAGGTNDV